MSVPLPYTALEGDCAGVSNNNTLYVLSQGKLQSLSIAQNATWSQPAQGESVADPACVTANGNDLWVIGGQPSDGTTAVQRYDMNENAWQTIVPLAADIIVGRTNHSAVFLNDSQSILIYAGSQPNAPSYYSSQTFLLSTQPPYNIESYTSSAPPLNRPLLQPWNSSHAIMIGGSDTNTDIWTFGPSDGWQQLQTNLTTPLDPSDRAVVVDGTDGSRVLQVYSLNTSPNVVSSVVLLDANGQTASTGQTLGNETSTNSSPRKRKRDLTIQDWPTYNSTNAPTATRTDCSIVQAADGVVVVAGGNSQVPVVLFDQAQNSWIDAGKFFNGNGQQPLLPSSTAPATSHTASATSAAPSASSSSADAGLDLPVQHPYRTLGIVLGVILGFVAFLVAMLLVLRWRRLQQNRNGGGAAEKEDKDRMSFADRGASFMKEAGVSAHEIPPFQPNDFSQNPGSHSSLAIIAGRFGNRKSGHAPKSSYESTARLVREKNGYRIGEPPVEMMNIGARRSNSARRSEAPSQRTNASSCPTLPEVEGMSSLGADLGLERKRSSGWSRYFETPNGVAPKTLSHIPSVYANDPAFKQGLDGQGLSHVTSGRPSFGDSREDLARRSGGGSLHVGSAHRKSQSASISSYGDRSTMGSIMTGDFYEHTAWSPTSTTFKDHLNGDRGTSSVYTNSIYDNQNRRYIRAKNSPGFFPGNGVSYKPPRTPKKTSHSAASSLTVPPKVLDPSKLPESPRLVEPAKPTLDRGSTLTVFPRGVPSAVYIKGTPAAAESKDKAPANSDMSWVNLG